MASEPKVLIVDDEPDLLDIYSRILRVLPSRPQIHTATTGARAMALLDSEDFSLLLTDLNMPKMDGFQVLAAVRRNYPGLRTAVITGMADPQYRARAYAIGVDLYLEKPQSRQEMKIFTDCIEGILDRVDGAGFRGVQSKNLVDLVQMESLSQSSSLLRVRQTGREGCIWIRDGEVIDAETGDQTGEQAFQEIMRWRSGSFEILPPAPERPCRIKTATQNLLLNFAQWSDESVAETPAETGGEKLPEIFRAVTRMEGVQSILTRAGREKPLSWGVEEVEQCAEWNEALWKLGQELGEKLSAGPLRIAVSATATQKMAAQLRGEHLLVLGLDPELSNREATGLLQRVGGDWA